jgi:methionyl-tRNA formyltransferase
MGTPAFAVPVLDALAGHHEVPAVFTRPDRATGRGRRIVTSPVHERAEALGLPVMQPTSLRGPEVVAQLAELRPDVIVVAAFGLILPPAVLGVPAHGCLNVHASLLPRWRGAAPVQRAILAGDETTGVSIMRMEEGLDTGPYCLQVPVPVDAANTAELTGILADAGAGAILLALEGLERGSLVWTSQDDSAATYAGKITAGDVALTPALAPTDALRRVRASGPSAPSRVVVGGRRLVVLDASLSPVDLLPGEAECSHWLDIGCTGGAIRLDTVIPEGRSRMSGDAFARGAKLGGACSWGAL